MMNKKYLLKGLLLILFIPGTVYYFFNTPRSEVMISSFVILIWTVMLTYEEVSLSINPSESRKKYQIGIDRIFVMLLIVISMDVLVSLWVNGISL